MSYIICAEVYTGRDNYVNMHGDKTKVDASILSERNGVITFDVPGDFHRQKELVLALCKSLLDAGFAEFAISHSY